jgi:mono/diheme cytochrome c family protein
MSTTRILVSIVGAGLFACCLAGEPELSPMAQEGQRLYEYYCGSCHGDAGRGNGPSAKTLTVKPTNLTKLAKKDGGEFPLERVTRSIDGRQRTPAHGNPMPIWGLEFQDPTSDVYQEGEVSLRIKRLIEYLQTIQE